MMLAPIRCRRAVFDTSRTWVMGVVNVTPDSFSDGGRFIDPAEAVAHGLRLAAEGADLLDVGGESTRPGSRPVNADEECRRVLPVIERLAAQVKLPISIDTRKAAVAERALAAGAELVNDIDGGRDEELLAVVGRAGVPLILGHLRGEPATMQAIIDFVDMFEEVVGELAAAVEQARRAGVTQLIVDPCLGFGKTTAHNVELLARAGELGARLGLPVMLGPSRKAFLGALSGQAVDARLPATLGAVVAAGLAGAEFVRVHDVRAARDALAIADVVRRAARQGKLPVHERSGT
jgi:dihydropteroate synthase